MIAIQASHAYSHNKAVYFIVDKDKSFPYGSITKAMRLCKRSVGKQSPLPNMNLSPDLQNATKMNGGGDKVNHYRPKG